MNLGLTREQIASHTKEDDIRAYNAYIRGEITEDEYCLYFLNLLENFIKGRIAAKKRTLGAEFEDLMQTARLMVIEHYKDYDPLKGSPSTYFLYYVDEATKKETLRNGEFSEHYEAARYRLNKVAKDAGYTGHDDPRLTPQTLSVLSGESLVTIMKVREMENQTKISFDTFEDNLGGFSKSPEELYYLQERSKAIATLVNQCSPLEQYLIEHLVTQDHPDSYKKVMDELKKEPNYSRYQRELPRTITQKSVQQKLNNALRRMRNSPTFKKQVSFNDNVWETVVREQATESDLQNFDFDYV